MLDNACSASSDKASRQFHDSLPNVQASSASRLRGGSGFDGDGIVRKMLLLDRRWSGCSRPCLIEHALPWARPAVPAVEHHLIAARAQPAPQQKKRSARGAREGTAAHRTLVRPQTCIHNVLPAQHVAMIGARKIRVALQGGIGTLRPDGRHHKPPVIGAILSAAAIARLHVLPPQVPQLMTPRLGTMS